MGESTTAGRSWRQLRFAAIQLASAGAGMVAWMVLPRIVSGTVQEPAIMAFALGPILALPLTLGVPATLPNAFRRSSDGTYLRSGSWSGPLRIVCWILGATGVFGILLMIAEGILHISLGSAALTASYAAAMGTWLIAAQVSRIKGSATLMIAGGALNPALPLAWMLFTGGGFSLTAATWATVIVMIFLSAGVWLGMGGLLTAVSGTSGLAVKRTLMLASVLVPHLALFAVLMQGIRLSAILVGAPGILEKAHLASLGVTMVSVLINSIHSLLSVRIQTADDSILKAIVRDTSIGYGVLAVISTIITLTFYVALPFVSGVDIPFAVALPLGLTVPAIVVYYACSGIQLRSGSAARLLVASSGAVIIWLLASLLVRAESLLGLAWVFTFAPVSLALIGAVLGAFNPHAVTRVATRTMIFRVFPWAGGSAGLVILVGVILTQVAK